MSIPICGLSWLSAGFRLNFFFRDKRLTYKNLQNKPTHFPEIAIMDDKMEKLWNPMSNIIYSNAYLGSIFYDKSPNFKILTRNASARLRLDTVDDDMIFPGDINDLYFSQHSRVEFICRFRLAKFPFDSQACSLHIRMKRQDNHSAVLEAKDGRPVVYGGPALLNDFYLAGLSTSYDWGWAFGGLHLCHSVPKVTSRPFSL